MHGSPLFSWHRGKFDKIGYLKTTNLPLSEADADSATAVLQKGVLVNAAANSETEMAFTTGDFYGILEEDVSLNGPLSDQAYLDRTLRGKVDIPIKRGHPASLRIPMPSSEAIFEGLGVAAINNLVITSGTGALSAATARKSELTCEKGGLRLAAAGEIVIALMEQANITPAVTGNLRIRVQFVSKYKKSA